MTSTNETLPTYGNPPLVETVLSVQFEPISKMTDAHLGAFWFQRKDDWPVVQTQQSIDPVIETFDEHGYWPPHGMGLRIGSHPEIRVQMINEEHGRMIQLQRNRLAFNWRRRRDEEYPRFESLYNEFDKALSDLRSVVYKQELGELKPQVWEIVYVNHITKGELWKTEADWPEIIPGLLSSVPASVPGVEIRGVAGQWVFELTPHRGRLYVDVEPRQRTDNSREDVFVLRLTARGPVNEDQSIDDGLNLGHRAIVQSFDRLISPKAQRQWERHDDTHST